MLVKVYDDIERFMNKEIKIRYDIIIIDKDSLKNEELKNIGLIKKISPSSNVYGYSEKDKENRVKMIGIGFDDFFMMPEGRKNLINELEKDIDLFKEKTTVLFCDKLGLCLNIEEYTLTIEGEYQTIGRNLLNILFCLLSKKGKVVGYEEIIAYVNEDYGNDSLKIKNCINQRSNFRVDICRINKIFGNECIETYCGVGYKWVGK
jgi:DNA-binding response OmpR family regulator